MSPRSAPRTAPVVAFLVPLLCALGDKLAQSQNAAPQKAGQKSVEVPEGNALEENDRKQRRDESLRAMKSRASQFRVTTATDDSDAELIATPLLRYADQPRRISDATLWGWVADGRLVAVCKIEHSDREGHPLWSNCFVSLALQNIDAEWSGERHWSASKAGIELQAIKTRPAAASGHAARLREMKEIAARFKATIVRPGNNREEMRLLPRPVFRYETPTGNLLDGAAFGLTSNGTNPDAVLVLELHGNNEAAPEWKFGVAGMSAGELSVNLDDKEVWSKPAVDGPGRFDTWFWFLDRE